jgi:hypothetical protein
MRLRSGRIIMRFFCLDRQRARFGEGNMLLVYSLPGALRL